jgi:hypothetical protein
MEELDYQSKLGGLEQERNSKPYPAPPHWSREEREEHRLFFDAIFERQNDIVPKLNTVKSELVCWRRTLNALENIRQELPLEATYKQEAEQAQVIFDEARQKLAHWQTEKADLEAAYQKAVSEGNIAEGARCHSLIPVYDDVVRIHEIELEQKRSAFIEKSQKHSDSMKRLSSWLEDLPGDLSGEAVAA